MCCVSDKCIVSDKFVALSLSVLCFEESELCYQCVCVVFSMCVVFCTYGPPYKLQLLIINLDLRCYFLAAQNSAS